MITGKLNTNLFSGNLDSGVVRNKNLVDYLNSEKQTKPETGDSFTLTSKPSEGMYNLEPVERYQYILKQAQQQQTKLDSTIIDPQKTIEEANKIINNAVTLPSRDNPDTATLLQAMQLKRIAESRLDMAA